MQKSNFPPLVSRRGALRKLAIAASVVVIPSLRARGAGESAHLDVKDPAAVAVGYVENAAKVDAKKFPTYAQGSNCENCLQLQGDAGAGYRPCALFPGKLVAVAGWCSGWTAEM